ncbi:CvpA family protein [Microbacterium sp. JZ37]|uniref:CvpA family protein n=1 Tax=Microbacterium sp. JZ37 TaxID=2654193 RepID=UPI002B45DB16|nr:CvpA family protein [Microbacterium sp. JZ37]WRH18282.1 ABC transporter [Microbacterium sp. JZ37]
MSDAQGSNGGPRNGDPIEESAPADAPETAVPENDDARAADAWSPADGQGAESAEVANSDERVAGTFTESAEPAPAAPASSEAPVADSEAGPADAAIPAASSDELHMPAAPEDDATAADAPVADAPADAPASTHIPPVDNDHDGEPDYAALAAELEEFERRNADASDSFSAPGAAGPTAAGVAAAGAADAQDKRNDPWFEPAKTETFSASEPAVTASEPVVEPQTTAAPVAPQPIFVQAPEPPKVRGNRGAAGLIGLVAAIVFAILYFAATLGWRLLAGEAELSTIAEPAVALLTSFEFWVPVVVFWLGFWLLGALVNRARWGKWVIFGLLVGVISYGGHLLGQLFQAPFWMLTPSQGSELVAESLLSPVAIVAFILGREITIWFGAWAARRGAKVTAQNAEAQAEYERTLEAGPQLSQ